LFDPNCCPQVIAARQDVTMQEVSQQSAAWYASRWFRVTAWIVLAAAIAAEGYYAVFFRTGDVTCHMMYGREFRDGVPFTNEGNFYPLGRVMFDVLFTLGNVHAMRTAFYAAAIVAFITTFWLWGRMVPAHETLASNGATELRFRNFAACVATIVVLLPFIIRDLDECGLQTLLLLMCTLGTFCFLHGHRVSGGFWLAAAATYKATPLLFLPFLIWKREWKTAGAMVVFLVGLNLLPAVYLGWEKTIACHRYWFAHTRAVTQTVEAYPSAFGLENPKHQNESLAATFARLVETYPPGHPLYVDSRLFVQFGNLPPAQAKLAVKFMTLLLGACVAWRMRRGFATNRDVPSQSSGSTLPSPISGMKENSHLATERVVAEFAVACAFSALLSPLCWKQHLVMLVPCVFLLARSVLDGRPQGRARVAAMFVISAVFFWTHRLTVGAQLALVITSYNPVTIGAVVMTFLVLSNPKSASTANASVSTSDLSTSEFRAKGVLLEQAA
jgi:hypothetical protein